MTGWRAATAPRPQCWLELHCRPAGIILAPQQRYGIGEQLRRLLRIHAHRTAEDMANQLEFLSHWR